MAAIELRITILPKAEGEYPLLFHTPVGLNDPTGSLELDPTSPEIREKLSRIKDECASDQFFHEFGALLSAKLLPENLLAAYPLSSRQSASNGAEDTLRVLLQILAPELRPLPWETLYVTKSDRWLSTSHRSPLSRYVDTAALRSLSVSLPLKILVCTARPVDLPSVKATSEINVVKNALWTLCEKGAADVYSLRRAGIESLRKTIEEYQPHVFHFVGHGGQQGQVAGIYLEAADGSQTFFPVELLAELLQRPGSVQVAILNACDTVETAYVLAQRGIASVGMCYPVRNEAAVCFCRTLYESLASGTPLDVAVNDARFALRVEAGPDRRDWFLPITCLPGGTANVFEFREPVTVVQVTSQPPGAQIEVDGDDSGKRTPDSVVFKDETTHRIRVCLSGYEPSIHQEVPASRTAQSQRLEFLLRSAAEANRIMPAWSSGLKRGLFVAALVATVVALCSLYLPATFFSKWGRSTAETAPPSRQGDEQTPSQGGASPFQSESLEPRRETNVKGSEKSDERNEAVSPLPIGTEASDTAAIVDDMIAIPEGKLCRGFEDSSVTIHLLRKYGVKAGSAVLEILRSREREVEIATFHIDKFEVTNAEYAKFLKEAGTNREFSHPDEPPGKDRTPRFWSEPGVNASEQPVAGVDWFDAYAFARWAGKRLPTEDEWELAARGTEKHPYPWGSAYSDQRYYGDVEVASGPRRVLDIEAAREGAPVAMGCNVAEWTVSPGRAEGLMIFRGGAWTHQPGDVYGLTFLPFFAPRETRNVGLGFRCVKDASNVNGEPPPGMIKIEGGRVLLGAEETPVLNLMRKLYGHVADFDRVFLEERPSTIEVLPFKIDRHEVTNAEYRRFLDYVQAHGDERVRHPEQPVDKDHTPAFWSESDFNGDEQPIVGVDWYDAYAFARWAGKRLPSADEWELAARGSSSSLYPWGDQFDKKRCACGEMGLTATVAVDAYAGDCSRAGVIHLAGNVMEWTDTDALDGQARTKIIRGGSWDSACEAFGVVCLRILSAERAHRGKALGFRCAAEVTEVDQ